MEKGIQARIKALKTAMKTESCIEEVEGMYQYNNPKEAKEDLAICEALLSRLTFRRGFFSVHQHLRKEQCKGCTAALKSINFTTQQLTSVLSSLDLTKETPAPGFEPHCNRRMLAPTPPRVCPIPEVTLTAPAWRNLVDFE